MTWDGIVKYSKYMLCLFSFLSLSILVAKHVISFSCRMCVALVIAASAGALISIISLFFFHSFQEERMVFFGSVGHPIVGASTYGLAAVMGYFCLNCWHNDRLRKARNLGVLIISAAVLFSQSRGPIIALYVTFLFGAIWKRDGVTVAILLFLPSALYAVYSTTGFEFGQVVSRGLSYRTEIWRIVIDRIEEHMWFGHGLLAEEGNLLCYGRVMHHHPHSGYLSTVFYGGLTGLVLFLCLLLACFKVAFENLIREKECMVMGMLMFAAMSIATDTNKLVTKPSGIWLFFWVPVAICAVTELRQRDRFC